MKETVKNLEYYINLPWSFSVERHNEKGREYYASRVNEWKCFSDGATPAEAMNNLMEALQLHIEASIEDGTPIQEPPKPEEFKGQIAYRTKPEKHYQIAKEANRRNISINKLIDQAVDSVISA
ncbi:type II toxin-antitoxin system HicB family antitoxin [Vampirovibrio sp.]|uniref:type II toxin-antitoxin system HicB family antitoxin n=1 Tax=Vampirovibrio sp. TaxID=2717857 RepID=UPI0035945BC8